MLSDDDALLIDALQIAPRASWAALSEHLGISSVTVAKRWQRLAEEGLAWVTVAPGMATSRPQCFAYVEVTCQPSMRLTAADTIATRLSTDEKLVGSIDEFKARAQTDIRFRAGQTVLSKEAKDALDEMAAPLKNQRGYIIEVQGFASGQGQTAIANSRKIADAVVRYLVLNHEIPAYRIYVLGLGNASASKGPSGTHVEINLLKNDLDQMAKQ